MRCHVFYLILIVLSISLVWTPDLLLAQTPSSPQEKLNAELLEAATNGQTEKVLALIKTGADVNAKDKFGNTALIIAVLDGRTDIVKALIDSPKTDVNAKDNDGDTALIEAATHGRTDIVKALIGSKADVNAKNNDGDTALIVAVRYNYTKMIHLLKSASAKGNP